jgi:hypothetical protein
MVITEQVSGVRDTHTIIAHAMSIDNPPVVFGIIKCNLRTALLVRWLPQETAVENVFTVHIKVISFSATYFKC